MNLCKVQAELNKKYSYDKLFKNKKEYNLEAENTEQQNYMTKYKERISTRMKKIFEENFY